jgi:hypothetical protein
MAMAKKAFKTWEKLSGSEYFLQMMKKDRNYVPFIFNLDAFLGQFRAITLAMQKELRDYPGFDEWYTKQQDWMENDPQMKLLLLFRNLTYHQGIAERRLEVAHHETIRLDVKESDYVYDEDGNIIAQKQSEALKAPETRQGPSIELEWFFVDPEIKEELEKKFSDHDVENLFNTDIITVCEECYNKLAPAIIGFIQQMGN